MIAPARVTRPSGYDDNVKRRQILEGARLVFMELGFDGASMGEIARAAGVSKGTLYVYFADKNALFEAIVEQECLEQGKFAFDFALPDLKIGIEVEGGVYARRAGELSVVGGRLVATRGQKSRHTTGSGYEGDCDKYNLAAVNGWSVLRFVSPQIVRGEAATMISDFVRQRKADRDQRRAAAQRGQTRRR